VFFQWNCLALEANVLDHNRPGISGDKLSLTQGPPASARALAMIHIAMFDAYNVVDGKYNTYLQDVRDTIDGKGASMDAAVASAGHYVMKNLYANVPEIIALIDHALERTLEGLTSDHAKKEKGVTVGSEIGELVMLNRTNDGYSADDPYLMQEPYVYESTGEPGDHDVDTTNQGQRFFNPGAGFLTPFGMSSIEPFRAPSPPGLLGGEFNPHDAEYIAALLEVKEKGNFRGGMADDAFPDDDPSFDIANAWSSVGSPCTGTPPRLYNIIARDIAMKKSNSLDDNALLFTMLNVGLGNAGIASWDSKYHYRLWRPILAIRNHPTSEDRTIRDENWSPLGASRSNSIPGETNFSPPSPAYTSGHATFGAVAFKLITNFYRTADIPFDFLSDEWNGMTTDQFGRTRPVTTRTFNNLTMAIAENVASQVFNGVHFRFDGTAGVEVGCKIANFVFQKLFLPMNGSSQRSLMPDGDYTNAIDCILEHPDYQESGLCDATDDDAGGAFLISEVHLKLVAAQCVDFYGHCEADSDCCTNLRCRNMKCRVSLRSYIPRSNIFSRGDD
jgi:hypothetical protein